MTDVLFDARGGGLGHAQRSVCIARKIPTLTTKVLTNSAFMPPFVSEGVGHIINKGSTVLADVFAAEQPRVFVVDAVIRDDTRELLAQLTCKKVFVYRHTTAELDLHLFDEVIVTEPGIDGVDAWPVLIRDPSELTIDESAGVVNMPINGDFHSYPYMETMARASLITGAPGYNTFWEAKSLGKKTKWYVQEKQYDDQAWRVQSFDSYAEPITNKAQVAADTIAKLVLPTLAAQPELRSF